MVVCKFFQQGNCRYGQSCRFEHIYGSKYSYHAPTHPQVPVQQTSSPSSVTDEQLTNQVHSDVQAALNGGQWLLSCYAPFKEKPAVPGISDLSPEESRLFIYEAKANNNMEAAVTYLNTQMQETRLKYEQLLQPTAAVMNLLKSLYHGGPVQSPFTSQSQGFGTSDNSANSIFRSAIQSAGFGQSSNASTSIFGQANNAYNNQQNSSFFGSQSDPAKSIFASANQNVFAGAQPINPFQNAAQDAAKSIFAQATQNVFGPSPPNQTSGSVFGVAPQNPFGQADALKLGTDVFSPSQGSQASVFQISDKPTTNVFGNVIINSVINEASIYSKMEDLCTSEIEAYEAPTFKLGFVPELPPPADLCR